MTTRILCVADGGITPTMMSALKELESCDAEVTIVEDSQMTSMAEITDRMGVIERAGIDAAPTCPELLANCAEADVIVVHVASVNREVIDAAPNLKLVCVLRGGYENADVEYLKSKGIRLTNAPWRSANAVADFTVGMMIAENKNIARSHHFLKEGKWVKRYPNQPFIRDMRKCTVGLVGFGYIGSRVAKRLSGFECRVVVFDPYVDAREIEAHGVDVADSLDSLLEASDFVSLHMRISSDTHHMIDAEALRRMKPTAYLVNTARADLVDEEALVDALRGHRIGGAAIDVYAEEPIGTDHPYLSLDNVTLVSHLAGTSADTMQTSVEIGYEDLEAYLKGEELINRRA